MSIIPSFFDGRRSELYDPFSANEWTETADGLVFKAEVPGLRKEEVKVEIEGGSVLHISGQRNMAVEQTSETSRVVEMSSGTFTRRMQLPENAKTDQIQASMENGVLTVTVPKEQATIQAASS